MEKFYKSLNKKVNNTKWLKACLKLPLCTRFVEGAYVAVVLYYLFNKDYNTLLPLVLKPAITLGIIIVFRKFYDVPRPFEKYEFTPIVEHDTGKSFPSKHSASGMIIALSLLKIQPVGGYVLLALTFIIGISRILTGVHHIKDVLAGYLLAIIIYII